MKMINRLKLLFFPSLKIELFVEGKEFTGTKKDVIILLKKLRIKHLLEVKKLQVEMFSEAKKMNPCKIKEIHDRLKCLESLITYVDINIFKLNKKGKGYE